MSSKSAIALVQDRHGREIKLVRAHIQTAREGVLAGADQTVIDHARIWIPQLVEDTIGLGIPVQVEWPVDTLPNLLCILLLRSTPVGDPSEVEYSQLALVFFTDHVTDLAELARSELCTIEWAELAKDG